MNEALRSFFVIVLVTVLLSPFALAYGAYWLFNDHIHTGSEVTVYTTYCSNDWHHDKCSGNLSTSIKESFEANGDTQRVITWLDDDPPFNLQGSAVRDAFTWECRGKATGEHNVCSLNHGELKQRTEFDDGTIDNHDVWPAGQVTKFTWYLTRLGEWWDRWRA